MDKYSDKVVMEIGGHDHWEDLRVFDRTKKGPIRNLMVSTGVSPDHGQLPGFSTLKIDE